ncbi:MAG: inositol monophosphatase family protein [Pseudomonadota bacterium]
MIWCLSQSDIDECATLLCDIFLNSGMFFRSVSGALMLAYVASGRLHDYIQDHIDAWDCFAVLLMDEEAGGYSCRLTPIMRLKTLQC